MTEAEKRALAKEYLHLLGESVRFPLSDQLPPEGRKEIVDTAAEVISHSPIERPIIERVIFNKEVEPKTDQKELNPELDSLDQLNQLDNSTEIEAPTKLNMNPNIENPQLQKISPNPFGSAAAK